MLRVLGEFVGGVVIAALLALWFGLPTGPVDRHLDYISWITVVALMVGAVVVAWRSQADVMAGTACVLGLAVLLNGAVLH